MRHCIVAVGRLKRGPERAMVDTYLERLGSRAIEREVELRRAVAAAERSDREAELLLENVQPSALIAALDEHGETLDSAAFAERLRRYRDDGVAEIAFLVGGADGHGAAVLDRARWRLSLGRMTWPHALARVLLVEQIYRAEMILAGHPYHRA